MTTPTLRTLSVELAADPNQRRVVLTCCAVIGAAVEPVTGWRRAGYDEALHALRKWGRTGIYGETRRAVERADIVGPTSGDYHAGIVAALRAAARVVDSGPDEPAEDHIHRALASCCSALAHHQGWSDYGGVLWRIARIVADATPAEAETEGGAVVIVGPWGPRTDGGDDA